MHPRIREVEGRATTPSPAVIGNQSVKATESGHRSNPSLSNLRKRRVRGKSRGPCYHGRGLRLALSVSSGFVAWWGEADTRSQLQSEPNGEGS